MKQLLLLASCLRGIQAKMVLTMTPRALFKQTSVSPPTTVASVNGALVKVVTLSMDGVVVYLV